MTSLESGGAGGTGALPVTLRWSQATVSSEAIERALYALADRVSGSVSSIDDEWILEAYPRDLSEDTGSLCHRIRQEVTDQSLRLKIAARTDPLRNVVFALAFSRTTAAKDGGDDQTPTGERHTGVAP